LNETQHDHDDGDNQENMNETAHCVRGDQAQQPEDDEDDCYSFKHLFSPFLTDIPQMTDDLALRFAPFGLVDESEPVHKVRLYPLFLSI